MRIYGAIEAGGTKFVCGVASGPDAILERVTIPTRDPALTLSQCMDFFRNAFARHGKPAAFGIGSFGALDPEPDSDWYGHIRETPKTGWTNVDMAGAFSREYAVPVGFDTDVNAAALAEYRFGAGLTAGIRAAGHRGRRGRNATGGRRAAAGGNVAADCHDTAAQSSNAGRSGSADETAASTHQAAAAHTSTTGDTGVNSLVYITVGTGVGAGAIADGHIVHGLLHPEMGHIPVSRESDDTHFAGVCPYHGDCLEGLASGPAIQARWGVPATDLPPGHEAWQLEARYLASFVVTLTGILSPEVIVLGGGVMHVPGLIESVRKKARARMGGYFPPVWDTVADRKTPASGSDEISDDIMERYIVPPVRGDDAGLSGAVALAMEAVDGT